MALRLVKEQKNIGIKYLEIFPNLVCYFYYKYPKIILIFLILSIKSLVYFSYPLTIIIIIINFFATTNMKPSQWNPEDNSIMDCMCFRSLLSIHVIYTS